MRCDTVLLLVRTEADMHKVRIVIETELEPEDAVKKFQEDFDFWPLNGFYIPPYERATMRAEEITDENCTG